MGLLVGYLGVVNVNVLNDSASDSSDVISVTWCTSAIRFRVDILISLVISSLKNVLLCKGLMDCEIASQNIQLRQWIRPEPVLDGEILYVLEYCWLWSLSIKVEAQGCCPVNEKVTAVVLTGEDEVVDFVDAFLFFCYHPIQSFTQTLETGR